LSDKHNRHVCSNGSRNLGTGKPYLGPDGTVGPDRDKGCMCCELDRAFEEASTYVWRPLPLTLTRSSTMRTSRLTDQSPCFTPCGMQARNLRDMVSRVSARRLLSGCDRGAHGQMRIPSFLPRWIRFTRTQRDNSRAVIASLVSSLLSGVWTHGLRQTKHSQDPFCRRLPVRNARPLPRRLILSSMCSSTSPPIRPT